MADKVLNILSFCGSLRKGSFNAALQRALPALAPEGMTITAGATVGDMPLYNHDIQENEGFPASVLAMVDAIKAADGVIMVSPEYNFTIPSPLKNAIDWLSRVNSQPFFGKPISI